MTLTATLVIPPASYPKGYKSNLFDDNPEIFSKGDSDKLLKFVKGARERFTAFEFASLFMVAAQHPLNEALSLIMAISAIEASYEQRPYDLSRILDENLVKTEFTREELEGFRKKGWSSTFADFLTSNLSESEKKQFVNLVRRKPGHTEEIEPLDDRVKRRAKALIYDIRSKFVHCAIYLPFPDKKQIEEYEGYFPSKYDGWYISRDFMQLIKILRAAWANYWNNEFNELLKDI